MSKYCLSFLLAGGSVSRTKESVPNDVRAYLKNLYGDYMTMPPVEESTGLHCIVNNNNKNILYEKIKALLNKYRY